MKSKTTLLPLVILLTAALFFAITSTSTRATFFGFEWGNSTANTTQSSTGAQNTATSAANTAESTGVISKISGIGSLFLNKIAQLIGVNQQASPYQQQTAPSSSQNSVQQQPASSGSSQVGGGLDKYGSNGSEKKPYVLEPNQFKKVCGKNEYVLWWSKRGTDGKDLKEVADKEQGGMWLVMPSCEALSKCHCCCNTCTKPPEPNCPPDVCFSKSSPCDGSTDCTPKCQCDKCKSECQNYQEPTHPKAFNRDCSCQETGCPDSNAKNCKIILFKSQATWQTGQYNSNGSMLKNNYNTQNNSTQITNNKPTAFQSSGAAAAKGNQGWIDKLEKDKGKCCKCVSEQEAKEGPQGSGK